MWYWNIHIKSFSLFGLEIQVWGLLLAIGILVAWFLFDYLLSKRKIKFESSWLVVGLVFSGLLGARLIHVFVDWDYYSKHLIEILYVWNGGMASFGAIIFIFIFLYLYFMKYKNKFDLGDFLDAASASLMIFLGFARIGCFLINDHIGKVTDLFWGIFTMGENRHPISAYYSLSAFIIFGILLYLYLKDKCKAKLFGIMMILYGIGRLLIDVFFKDFMGDDRIYWFMIVFTVLLVIGGVGFIIYNNNDKTGSAN